MVLTRALALGLSAAAGALLALLIPVPSAPSAPIAGAAIEVENARDQEPSVPALAEPPVASEPSLSRTPLESAGSGDAVERLVYGSLRAAGGGAVREGRVSFLDALGELRRATVGANAYSIVGLAPGAWSVRADCAGFLPLERALTLDPLAEETRLDLLLEPALVLRVKFVDPEGKTIVDATSGRPGSLLLAAVATRERPLRLRGVRSRMPSWYEAGTYRSPQTFEGLEGLPPDCAGLLELHAPLPLWISAVLGGSVLESRFQETGADEIVFVLEREVLQRERGGLRVRFTDGETGRPLQGRASLEYADAGGGGRALDADGAVEFTDEIAGLRELEPHVPGYPTFQRVVRVLPGITTDLGTLPLFRERSVRGRILDEDGRPLATALSWTPAASVASQLDVRQPIGVRTDADGRFRLFAAGRGELFLFAGRDELAANPIRIPAGGDAEIEAVAPRGTLLVIRPLRHAGPGALFALADEQGRAFWSGSVWEHRPLRVRLVPGTYQLWSCRDEEVETVETLTIGEETRVLER